MTLRELLNEASSELTSAGTGKKIRYFTEWHTYPDGSGSQIVQNEDGTFDLYASDTDGGKEMYKDKDCYIGSINLVKDDSKAKDSQERTVYELFKKYIDKIPAKTRSNIRKRVNGKLSFYKYREYFEEI